MTAKAEMQAQPEAHYLEAELQDLVSDAKVWQFIQAGSLDGVWYWDLENPENEWMSPEFWQLLGFDPATKPHDPAAWQDLVHPEDLKLALENFEAHCKDPDHPYDQIVRYRHADGSTVWVRCRGLAIRGADGTPTRMLGAHNDVTPLKHAEQTAIQERRLATYANEELQAFAYSTSHDLKAPANTIRMLLQEARRAIRMGDAEDADSMLNKAETTNEAMRVMVDKLLDYTSIIGNAEVALAVNLDDLVSDVLNSLSADIEEARARVIVAPLGHVLGTDWQLRKVFQNLISNAIKFQAKDKTPKVSIRGSELSNGKTLIEISDNGIGIAHENKKRIFDLFGKLHRPSTFSGSGIGLAYCARVAKVHGTEITVSSKLGEGTTFSFMLPSTTRS